MNLLDIVSCIITIVEWFFWTALTVCLLFFTSQAYPEFWNSYVLGKTEGEISIFDRLATLWEEPVGDPMAR